MKATSRWGETKEVLRGQPQSPSRLAGQAMKGALLSSWQARAPKPVFSYCVLVQQPEIQVHKVREVGSDEQSIRFVVADGISGEVECAQVFELPQVDHLWPRRREEGDPACH